MAKVLEGTEAWTARHGEISLRSIEWGPVYLERIQPLDHSALLCRGVLTAVQGREGVNHIPFGAAKWITFPSSLNMLTSSIACIGCTFIFFNDVWSFLSSVPELLWTFFIFLRGVPFPLCSGSYVSHGARRFQNSTQTPASALSEVVLHVEPSISDIGGALLTLRTQGLVSECPKGSVYTETWSEEGWTSLRLKTTHQSAPTVASSLALLDP